MTLSAAAVNAMLTEHFPGASASCAELGPDYAVASNPITDFSIRPGGFVSGLTQFAMADRQGRIG